MSLAVLLLVSYSSKLLGIAELIELDETVLPLLIFLALVKNVSLALIY
jgi:hypothetical protein